MARNKPIKRGFEVPNIRGCALATDANPRKPNEAHN